MGKFSPNGTLIKASKLGNKDHKSIKAGRVQKGGKDAAKPGPGRPKKLDAAPLKRKSVNVKNSASKEAQKPIVKVLTAPAPPRRNWNAYQLWAFKTGERLRKEHVRYTKKHGFGKLNKDLARMWRKMEESKKRRYERLAKKDKERYDKEMRLHNLRLARLGVRTSRVMHMS